MSSDAQHPFFAPLWRRVLLTAFCGAWAGFEFYNQNSTWGWLTVMITVYAIWTFFITYSPPPESGAPENEVVESVAEEPVEMPDDPSEEKQEK
ncbi:MAG: hypothetical protein HWE23_15115 [Rhodobacteraceae bacterium]|nr:hypothetical protein [Paracoccaceae bacterium]